MKANYILMIGSWILITFNVHANLNTYTTQPADTIIEEETEITEFVPVKVGDKKVLLSEDGEIVISEEEEIEVEIENEDFFSNEDVEINVEKEIIHVKEGSDTTRIKIGKKGITIVEEDKKASIDIEDIDEDNDFFKDIEDEDDKGKFKGHWAGFEFGLNNYLNSDFSLTRTDEDEFMDVNTSKSFGFNLNFGQYSLGLGTEKAGLVTGVGFEWNHYHFDNLNTITKVDGRIVADTLNVTPNKSKLSTLYFNVPLLFEIQLGGDDRSDRVHLAAGVIGGAKVTAYTKVVWKGDSKDKDKVKDDFNLSPFRYGYTARVGYKALNLYAIYYPTPLFETGKGPELYPFQAGISFYF